MHSSSMATARSYISRPSYRFLDVDLAAPRDSSSFELDESDLYNSPRSNSPDSRHVSAPNSQFRKKPAASTHPDPRPGAAAASSLPVNVPDWSKILREEYRENRRKDSLAKDFFDDDEEEEEEAEGEGRDGNRGRRWVPPHELVARTTRMASSFSVKLKGRDLSRVRNAIWAKTGFQD